MPHFEYTGVNRNGQRVSGKILAEAEADARGKLRLLGINVRRVASVKGDKGRARADDGAWRPISIENGDIHFQFLPARVSGSDLAVFTKQFSTLVDSGVTVVQALDMLAQQSENRRLKAIIPKIRAKVETGVELSEALAQFPEVFNQLYRSLVKAGAAAGQLDVMLRRLSTYIEKSNKLTKQFIGAMFYPAMVISIAIAMTAGMLMFVVPMFAQNFAESGRSLPALTQMLIDFSELMQSTFIYWSSGLVASGIAFDRWRKTVSGKRTVDRILLKVPAFGPLFVKIALARFTSTMAILVSSGIAIIEALEICSQAIGNVVVEEDISSLKGEVAKGRGLGAPMSSSKIIPAMVSGMVSVGESSGSLDQMLSKIAEFYEDEVESAMAAALKIVEPVMFVVIGAIVGFILVAMYLPIFDMAGGIQ